MQAWTESDLRTASIIVDGYAGEARLPREATKFAAAAEQAETASREFVGRAAVDLQQAVERLSRERAGTFIRLWYETLLTVVVAALLYRFLKNFLYDSWLVAELGIDQAKPLYGFEFFLAAGVVLLGWSGLLLWSFTSRLKRGITREIQAFQTRQQGPTSVSLLFAPTESDCREARRLIDDLATIERRAAELRRRVTNSESPLGHKR